MIHRLPWPLIPGLTSFPFSAADSTARRVQVYAVNSKRRWQSLCPKALCKYKCACMHMRACAHVFEVWMLIYKAHLQKHQMSKVHCGTLLTSNVTNNFFLQLHCSNPFSGLWNGNIITFLWCSAFDKTATCWAECLTELDAFPKPSPLSTLLLSPYSSPLFLSVL